MSHTRTVTVIAEIEGSNKISTAERRSRAKHSAINTFASREHVAQIHPNVYDANVADQCYEDVIVPLSSSRGDARVTTRLEETREARRNIFTQLLQAVDEDGIEEFIENDNHLRQFRRLGRWDSFLHTLYDGTGYSRGRPLLSRDAVSTVKNTRSDSNSLFTVEIEVIHE